MQVQACLFLDMKPRVEHRYKEVNLAILEWKCFLNGGVHKKEGKVN